MRSCQSRIKDGPKFRGKPTCGRNLLVACNRVDGDVTFVDIADPAQPKVICQFALSGSPDFAFIGGDSGLIPAGYQGLFSFVRR